MQKKNNPIGILGGTFDPIHFGHLRMGLEIYQNLNLQEIRFIPCKQPVHKNKIQTTAQQRLDMLRLALHGQDGFVIDEREVKRKTPSYMFETLTSLRKEVDTQPLCLILGMDAFAGFNTWYAWQKLFDLAHIIVVIRPDFTGTLSDELQTIMSKRMIQDAKQLSSQPAGFILKQSITYLNISASAIRNQIAEGKSPRYLLPETVLDYIEKNKVYGRLG